jgi:tetratricopeptide (TPR) repeat protein
LRRHYNWGFAYVDKGDYDSAIEDYEITLRLDPNDTDTREALELTGNREDCKKENSAQFWYAQTDFV